MKKISAFSKVLSRNDFWYRVNKIKKIKETSCEVLGLVHKSLELPKKLSYHKRMSAWEILVVDN